MHGLDGWVIGKQIFRKSCINVLLHRARQEVKGFLSTSFCLLANQSNPRFGDGFPFSYEAGVNLPKAIIEWIKGNPVDTSMLVPRYGRMFAKNDYLVEVGV